MARNTAHYVCQACGASCSKWNGRCDSCGAWNTLIEEATREQTPGGLGKGGARSGRSGRIDFVDLKGSDRPVPRLKTNLEEFDRVCGSGLVAGSALLVGGDPGIGKSTLLLQVAAAVADEARVAYISGEESIDQLRLRAARLGLAAAKVDLAAATNLRNILTSLDVAGGPNLVIIDSIQTMYVDSLDSAPGTVAQVRASAQELIRLAKRRKITILLVGHVTKEGMIAGPRVLEHMVDTVLYFEGERGHQFRILRAVKNRFGPTNEIGVFEMTDGGLMQVSNPSALFLSERPGNVSGAVVFAGMEGTRPMLVEIQALVAPSSFGTPRRAVVGWDGGRLAMILAVLETRCGLTLGNQDVYLNVAGGLRIAEPAADLAVAAALVSAFRDIPFPQDTVTFGEIGLSGEVRAVSQRDARLKEAAKLGFAEAFLPQSRKVAKKGGDKSPLSLEAIHHLTELGPLLHRKTKTTPRQETQPSQEEK